MSSPVDFRLYLITDRKTFGGIPSLLESVERALKGGVRAVQLREKDLPVRELLDASYRFRELTARYEAKLFVNDRVDIALSVGADGVHLGGEGMPVGAVRKLTREGMLLGVSTHSLEEAKKAEEGGADFITFGPVYETPSKLRYGRPLGPGIISEVRNEVSVPVFAIGGIGKDRVADVLRSGAYGVALISAILGADNVTLTAEEFMRLLK